MPLKGKKEKEGLGREMFNLWCNFAIIPNNPVGSCGADCSLEESYIGEQFSGPCSVTGWGCLETVWPQLELRKGKGA